MLFPFPGYPPDPGIEPRSSVWQADSLPLSPLGSPTVCGSLVRGLLLTQEQQVVNKLQNSTTSRQSRVSPEIKGDMELDKAIVMLEL